ncbi:nitronate monooxygenase [Williamsia deligens]|uniref:Nitronate monooxygenase n=1 Tax=Williamsia deligens TaxID=321325 RepID=A0ABW3G3L3_9NOCA|nr:nitronate monooxygenase [Williamsia deligens]
MGGAAGGALAGAISRAGGLGMVGMGSTGSAERLSAELALLDTGGRPVGVGLVDWRMRQDPDLLRTAIAAHPTLLSVSFGGDLDWVATARSEGITTTTQVATVAEALRAQDAGVDVVVARGLEGGGHGGPQVGALPLLCAVLDALDIPVLAAGGVASARGLAAVLAAGAAGAWIGTLFSACTESLADDRTRAVLAAADETTTEVTTRFDHAAGFPWPEHLPQRVISSAGADSSPVDAGQGVGMVGAPRPAADVLADLTTGAAELLGRWSS